MRSAYRPFTSTARCRRFAALGLIEFCQGKLVAIDWPGLREAGDSEQGYLHTQRTEDRGQRTEDRGQRTEDRGQRTEDRGQRTEDRGQRTEDRGQRTEDRGQRTEDRGQRTEDRGQRTEDRGQRTEDGRAEDIGARDVKRETVPVRLLSSIVLCARVDQRGVRTAHGGIR